MKVLRKALRVILEESFDVRSDDGGLSVSPRGDSTFAATVHFLQDEDKVLASLYKGDYKVREAFYQTSEYANYPALAKAIYGWVVDGMLTSVWSLFEKDRTKEESQTRKVEGAWIGISTDNNWKISKKLVQQVAKQLRTQKKDLRQRLLEAVCRKERASQLLKWSGKVRMITGKKLREVVRSVRKDLIWALADLSIVDEVNDNPELKSAVGWGSMGILREFNELIRRLERLA
jgi:hypothetical protein